jgi:hypothetical protein
MTGLALPASTQVPSESMGQPHYGEGREVRRLTPRHMPDLNGQPRWFTRFANVICTDATCSLPRVPGFAVCLDHGASQPWHPVDIGRVLTSHFA